MTLDFDFGVTGINSLLRLNRNTGLVDMIDTSYSDGGNTVFTSLGNGKYQLQLKLDGGTGDLFKYNDGTAFVGVQAAAALGYWDNDANAGNNDVATGGGLGGGGNWDAGFVKVVRRHERLPLHCRKQRRVRGNGRDGYARFSAIGY